MREKLPIGTIHQLSKFYEYFNITFYFEEYVMDKVHICIKYMQTVKEHYNLSKLFKIDIEFNLNALIIAENGGRY